MRQNCDQITKELACVDSKHRGSNVKVTTSVQDSPVLRKYLQEFS